MGVPPNVSGTLSVVLAALLRAGHPCGHGDLVAQRGMSAGAARLV